MKYQQGLNAQQVKAVEAIKGPVLVLAGPGSGKTRVLTYKIAYLIEEIGIPPFSILGVTFTNKAADEMKERIHALVNENSLKGLWLGTFHSVCGRVLRRENEHLNLSSNFTIYDRSDSEALVRKIFKRLEIDPDLYNYKDMMGYISNLKSDLITPVKFAQMKKDSRFQEIACQVYEEYQDYLRKNNAVDFDDMIMKTVLLFRRNKEVRENYSSKFKYILVDEFQDTSKSQYELLKALHGKGDHLTVIGDDDQSIYSWRGANVKNILHFPNDFENTTTVQLKQNYRSTANILNAANSLVDNNMGRHEKDLESKAGPGNKVFVTKYGSGYSEAEDIASKVQRMIQEKGVPGKEIAILYRVNSLSRKLENALQDKQLPYTVVGGIKFYERAEIKDALAFLRVVNNPRDNHSLMRIINKPKRGIGKRTVAKLEKHSRETGESIFDLAREDRIDFLSTRRQNKVKDFIKFLEGYIRNEDGENPSEMLTGILDDTGYLQELRESTDPKDANRVDNIKELIADCFDFCLEYEGDDPLQNYLENVSLITDVDTWNREQSSVNLLTVHSAKGLEFKKVFVVALEDGLFPLVREEESPESLEEERRLLYVAMTRAKEDVFLSWAQTRNRFGEDRYNRASRFLEEIEEQFVQKNEKPKKRGRVSTTDSFNETFYEEEQEIQPGTVVKHPSFGEGIVNSIRGYGGNRILTINFFRGGKKQISSKYVDLEIVED